uniref:Uncharacterized protein n=1 Tax=Octopus bimaculoides TaxID=37653 RepID=A0A0L8GM86_OCTBM
MRISQDRLNSLMSPWPKQCTGDCRFIYWLQTTNHSMYKLSIGSPKVIEPVENCLLCLCLKTTLVWPNG